MMMDLYVLGGGAVVILVLFAWGKIQSARLAASQANEQAATESVKSALVVVAQTEKTSKAVIAAKETFVVKQKADQVKIDAGIRDAFSSDGFE